jgi:hypothetical protein
MVSLLTVHSKVERISPVVQSGGTAIMEGQQIAAIRSFCLNEECEDYKKNQSEERGEMRQNGNRSPALSM